MNTQEMVYLLDDDASVRKSLSWMLESKGMAFKAFETAAAFLEETEVIGPSCLILDLHLPGMGGMDVLKAIKTRESLSMPVIILTGTGSVATVVQSMKLGAYDFLEKPVDPAVLLEKVHESLVLHAADRARTARKAALKRRVDQLTEREREVLGLLCEGKSTKQMAMTLNISIKTVSIHRWHLMKKLQAGSATEAVHLALRASAA